MDYTEEFERFWRAYPKRWNRESGRYYKVGKWEAFQAWKRLSNKDKADIFLKVKYMKTGQYVLDAHRWLKKRRFDDIEIPKSKPKLVIAKHIEKKPTPKAIEAREKFAVLLAKRKAPTPTMPTKEFDSRRNKALKDLKGE